MGGYGYFLETHNWRHHYIQNSFRCVLKMTGRIEIYMLFAGWEVRIVKNCDRGLENAAQGHRPRAAFSSPRSQFFTIRTDPKPVNNLFMFFQALKQNKTHRKQTRASVTVTVVRDKKIRTTLRTNQIVGFVTVPDWKKIKCFIFFQVGMVINPTIWLVLSAVRIFLSQTAVTVTLAWVFFREFFFFWELGKKQISYLPATLGSIFKTSVTVSLYGK